MPMHGDESETERNRGAADPGRGVAAGSFARAFAAEVCDVVAQIPVGKVFTYGQIARLVGRPRHARFVGAVLAHLPAESALPAWRVVDAQGRTVPFWPQQQELLEREGVRFRAPGRVDMKCSGWNPFGEF